MRVRVERRTAKLAGERYYLIAEPCIYGHLSVRYTANGACVACGREARARWRVDDPERTKQQNRAYLLKSPEKMHDSCKRWRQKNKEYLRIKSAAYRAANPGVKRTIERNRLARKMGNGGTHSAADIAEIMKAQRGRCGCCRKSLKNVVRHVDHIVPLARGGRNDRRNLQILCATCNCEKHARDPIEFMRTKGRLL